jgi:hypothetical protein
MRIILTNFMDMLPNVELTGRGTESWKIKPHYNRAPVERHVRVFMD